MWHYDSLNVYSYHLFEVGFHTKMPEEDAGYFRWWIEIGPFELAFCSRKYSYFILYYEWPFSSKSFNRKQLYFPRFQLNRNLSEILDRKERVR